MLPRVFLEEASINKTQRRQSTRRGRRGYRVNCYKKKFLIIYLGPLTHRDSASRNSIPLFTKHYFSHLSKEGFTKMLNLGSLDPSHETIAAGLPLREQESSPGPIIFKNVDLGLERELRC